MPFNTKLFPTDYTAETVPGVEIDAPSPIESDVERLQLEVKRNVILAANQARRVAAAAISNQNRLTAFVYPTILPKEWVGRRKYPVPGVLGVKAIIAGGRYIGNSRVWYDNTRRFTYSNEVASWVGMYLVQPRSYSRDGFSSATDGYVPGGYSVWGSRGRAWPYIDKINFATEASTYIGWLAGNIWSWTWLRSRYGIATTGNQVAGYMFGGRNHISYYFNLAEKLNYSNDVRTQLGITFTKTLAWGQCATTKVNAYVLNAHSMGPGYSSNSRYWQHWRYRSQYSPLDDIYKFTYGTETAASLGKNTVGMEYGGATFEYVEGDRAYCGYGFQSGVGYAAQAIERWDFLTETMASTGVNLSMPRHGCSSMQSSAVGYFAGGYNPSTWQTSQRTTDRFVPNSETNVRLGTTLWPWMYYTPTLRDYHGGIA